MQPDLQGLEITPGELKHLSGLSANAAIRPPKLRKFLAEILQSLLIIGLISVSGLLLIMVFPDHRLSLMAIHLILAVTLLIQDAFKIILTTKNRHFVSLLEDVDRYNKTIKSIDITDQLEAAGNPGVQLKDRARVIEALKLTREDLIRALKTERILRENQRFIRINPDLFATNINALAALQVDEKASEYGRILNEAFEIGMSIQDEMKQLQEKRYLK